MTNVLKMKRPRRSAAAELSARADFYAGSAKVAGKWTVNNLPEITEIEVAFLRKLMSMYGSKIVGEWMQVSEGTAMRVAAGCGHRCRPDTMVAIKVFFAKADLDSVTRGYGPGRDSPQKRGPKPNGKAKQ